MSQGTVLVIAGALICLGGLAKLGSSQVGGFSLKNFGINFGGSITQTSRVGDVSPEAAKTHKPDWGAIAIAAIGLATALVGLFK
jgi:hypothetical protein